MRQPPTPIASAGLRDGRHRHRHGERQPAGRFSTCPRRKPQPSPRTPTTSSWPWRERPVAASKGSHPAVAGADLAVSELERAVSIGARGGHGVLQRGGRSLDETGLRPGLRSFRSHSGRRSAAPEPPPRVQTSAVRNHVCCRVSHGHDDAILRIILGGTLDRHPGVEADPLSRRQPAGRSSRRIDLEYARGTITRSLARESAPDRLHPDALHRHRRRLRAGAPRRYGALPVPTASCSAATILLGSRTSPCGVVREAGFDDDVTARVTGATPWSLRPALLRLTLERAHRSSRRRTPLVHVERCSGEAGPPVVRQHRLEPPGIGLQVRRRSWSSHSR